MKRALKNIAKKVWYNTFSIGQKCGVDILPRHFYSEVPDIAKLKATESWRKPYNMEAISGDGLDSQLDFIKGISTGKCDKASQRSVYEKACQQNGEKGFGPIETQVLYGFICNKQPAKIIQIGCGVSTAIILQAASDIGYSPEIICIEPYPGSFLNQMDHDNKITLVKKGAQDISREFFEQLNDGDFFFVDSSHTLGPAGEVTRIIIDFLPVLNDGVYVHFHDIWFPYDYAGRIFEDMLTFCHESALLMAFMTLNSSFKVIGSLSMLHYNRQGQLKELFPEYKPRVSEYAIMKEEGHYPSSIYIRRTGTKG